MGYGNGFKIQRTMSSNNKTIFTLYTYLHANRIKHVDNNSYI